MLILLISRVSLFLYREITIASPTAASAAATVRTKKTKICPLSFPRKLEKETRDKFMAFNISSMHINITMAFLRTRTPTTPILNSTALNTRNKFKFNSNSN